VTCAALVGVVLLAACGSQAVPDRFSGTWRLRDGRTIPIRRVAAREGRAALLALHGRPCRGAALYFRATYFGGARLAGCATGDGTRLRGRFDDRGMTGAVEQRIVGSGRFAAIVRGDGARPFRIVAKRVRS
jgi:hypothetical protein